MACCSNVVGWTSATAAGIPRGSPFHWSCCCCSVTSRHLGEAGGGVCCTESHRWLSCLLGGFHPYSWDHFSCWVRWAFLINCMGGSDQYRIDLLTVTYHGFWMVRKYFYDRLFFYHVGLGSGSVKRGEFRSVFVIWAGLVEVNTLVWLTEKSSFCSQQQEQRYFLNNTYRRSWPETTLFFFVS